MARNRKIALTAFGGLTLFISSALSQTYSEPPKAVADRLALGNPGGVILNCKDDRYRAFDLARYGERALPEIEPYLLSLEDPARATFNEEWFLLVYAKIKGPAALPRIFGIAQQATEDGRPSVGWLGIAIALAQGNTAYVSEREDVFGEWGRHCAFPAPRDAVSRFILAWLLKDEAGIRSVLTPASQVGLVVPKTKVTDAELRARKLAGTSRAVGYKFESTKWISAPTESLEWPIEQPAIEGPLSIPTEFTDWSGQTCGRRVINFQWGFPTTGTRLPIPHPLIDDSAIRSLGQMIDDCAAQR